MGLKESGQGHEVGPVMAPSPTALPPCRTQRATGFFPWALESMNQQPGTCPGQCLPTHGREPRHPACSGAPNTPVRDSRSLSVGIQVWGLHQQR